MGWRRTIASFKQGSAILYRVSSQAASTVFVYQPICQSVLDRVYKAIPLYLYLSWALGNGHTDVLGHALHSSSGFWHLSLVLCSFYGLGWGRGSGNSSKMHLDLPRASTAASTQSSACHLLQVASCASFLPYIKGTHLPRHIHMGVIILHFSTPSKSSAQARAKPSADKRKRDPVHKQCSSPPPELSSPSPVSSLCFFKLALLWATSSLSSLSCFARQPFSCAWQHCIALLRALKQACRIISLFPECVAKGSRL